MKEGVKLWFFILLLPFFLALGHDLYANYYLDADKKTRLEAFEIDPKAYQSSDMGYLFMKYVPDAFDAVRDSVGEEDWIRWVDPILRLYTFVIALVPAILFAIWLLVSRLLDLWIFAPPVAGNARKRENGKPLGKAPIKYTRR